MLLTIPLHLPLPRSVRYLQPVVGLDRHLSRSSSRAGSGFRPFPPAFISCFKLARSTLHLYTMSSIQETTVGAGEVFTTSNVFLDVLVQAGITHACKQRTA